MSYDYRDEYPKSSRRRASQRRIQEERRRARRRRQLRNRTIIIATGLLILALIMVLISSFFSCVCSGPNRNSTLDTATKAAAAKKKTSTAKQISFKEPDIQDATDPDTQEKLTGVTDGEIYIWNKKAFEIFGGSKSKAEAYAALVNKAQKTLGDKIKVYSMIIPNHTEMGLPGRLKNVEGGAQTTSQADYIKQSYSKMNLKGGYINIYNELSKHCNEYIYFDSDHHWTGLGAYYAYKAFAEDTKQKVLSLSDCEEKTIEGFTGSFTNVTNYELNTDAVHFWNFPYDVTDEMTELGTTTPKTLNSPYYQYAEPGANTYGVFLYGDNPLEVLTSKSTAAKDKKIAVVHESYGNAFVPYLTYNYKTVYSIDFRHWNGDLKDFCEENDITEVIFANGVMSSATAIQTQAIEAIIG